MLSKYDNVGGDGNLAVVLFATDYPNVRCDRIHSPSIESCSRISDDMKTTQDTQTFGRGQQVDLPCIMSSRELSNAYSLNTKGITQS